MNYNNNEGENSMRAFSVFLALMALIISLVSIVISIMT